MLLAAYLLSLLYSCNTESATNQSVRVERDGTTIACQRCGTGDTTLLFIHGWCINKEYWDEQVKAFCPRYTVVTIDLPGFGASGHNRKEWSFANYTEDVKKVIDELRLKNVILIGHSMSGDIILQAGNRYPEKLIGIVGIDNLQSPVAPMQEEQQKQYAAFFDQLSRQFDSTVNQFMRGSLFQPSTPAAVAERVMNNVFTADSVIAIQVLRELYKTSQDEQILMRGLSHRLRLIASDVVPVQADSLNRYCAKGFSLETIHGSGHYPMLEQPAAFNAALQRTIDAIGH